MLLRSHALLLLLVGAAFASLPSAWEDGKEYTYKIKSRTIAAFNSRSDQYAGNIMSGRLTVQPNGPETLRAKISQARYSPVHTSLTSWDAEIPENLMNMQTFPLSGKPFEIKMKNGVVKDLVVDKDVPTWEVNIIKSIVSQLQIDTKGENVNKKSKEGKGKWLDDVFKVMEDSVGGKCEVTYDIAPMPEQQYRKNPELVPMPELRGDDDIRLLVKTKNYTNCDQRVSYHFGVNGRNKFEPGSSDNGKYLSRSSVSRIALSGTSKKFTIQSSTTTNKVILNPDQEDNQHGMVNSKISLILQEMKDISEPISPPTESHSTGNLVYNYNSPFETASTRRKNQIGKKRRFDDTDTSNSEERKWNKGLNDDARSNERESPESSDSVFDNDDNTYLQPKPKLTEPPHNPMLPYFIGYNGNSISKSDQVDVVKSAKKVAQEIGEELQKPDEMPDQDTLEKFTILSRLIRTMNADEIAAVQRELYERPKTQNELSPPTQSQRVRRNTWEAFRDAVAQAGTGPALVNVKQWVQSKQIQGNEAAKVVDAMAKSTRNPTSEYMDAYFEMIQSPETQQQPEVRDASILAFADLIRHAIVNKHSAHNRYPVHAFGKFSHKNYRNLHAKYFPFMSEELSKAVEAGDSQKIQVLVTAIGRTAHPRMLSILEPYIEGRKPVSPYQRLVMVMNLNKLATSYPKVARSVLYKIYSSSADHHEIRTAAVYMLMKTNPPAGMLQRMADNTNYDSSKHVNSAVKSSIQSIAQLENGELSDAAKTALPLLTSEIYDLQYSRAIFKNIKDRGTNSAIAIEATYIGSDDSIVPKGVFLTLTPTYHGLKITKLQLGGAVSTVQNLWNFVQKKLNNDRSDNLDNAEAQQKMYSPENLARMLGLQGQESPQQVEGFAFMNEIMGNHFWSFDNHTLEKVPQELRQLRNMMRQGINFDETKMNNYEVTMSFPTETGYPLTFTLKTPTLVKVKGQTKAKDDVDSDTQTVVPKSISTSGKMQVIYGMKIQKRLGFVAPFEHQEYMGGIDRNIQVHLPIRSEIEYDINKREARVKIQPNEDELNFKVFQYKSQPFTTKHDILSMKPVSNDQNTLPINEDMISSSQYELNDLNNKQRVQFNYDMISSRPLRDIESNAYKRELALDAAMKMLSSVASLYSPNNAKNTEYEKYSVKLSPNNDMSLEMKVSYDSMETEGNNDADDSDDYSPKAKAPSMNNNMNENERKQNLLREVTENINSAKAGVVNLGIKLNGDMESSLTVTAAVGRSEVDPKSRALLLVDVKVPNGDEYYMSAGLEGKSPHVESMDYEETLKAKNQHEFDSELYFGKKNDEKSRTRLGFEGKVKQSEEGKAEIRQSSDAQECIKQVKKHGNKMNSVCQKVNERALTLNAGDFVVTFENDSELQNIAMSALQDIYGVIYFDTTADLEDKSDSNKIKISFEKSPKDEKVYLIVKTPEGKVTVNDLQFSRQLKENIENEDSDMISSENNCFLDKSEAKTFDNHRYSLKLGKCWHVVMTPYPKADPDRPTQRQEIPRNMHASVLARENENGQKEMKVTLGDKEVELLTTSSRKVEAKVDGKKVDYSKKKSHQEKKNGETEFEIFELPDGSVTVISDKYDLRVSYDGIRSMIEAGDTYRNSVRGLCGNNDADSLNDQRSPKGCLLMKPEEFSATYALTSDEKCEGPARENAKKAEKSECLYDSPHPRDVINDREAGRETERSNGSDENNYNDKEDKKCMKHRTMVTRTDSQICFSTRPIPKCSSSCTPKGMKSRKIDFHCVSRTSASEKVAERVEQGANPDLSQKIVSKTENHQIPINCKA